jgi:hypothetical protein
LPRIIVGGALVIWSVFSLRDVLHHKPNLASDHLHIFATPACSSGTTTNTDMALEGRALLVRLLCPLNKSNAPFCDELNLTMPLWSDSARQKEIAPSAVTVFRDNRRPTRPQTLQPDSEPIKGTEISCPWDNYHLGKDCIEYPIPPSKIDTGIADVTVQVEDALDERSFTKSVLAFEIDHATVPIRLFLPGYMDVSSSSNARGYENRGAGGGGEIFQVVSFVPVSGHQTTFFLENLQSAEQKDSLVLIYGVILGTGAALLAEAVASVLRRLLASPGE